MEKVAPVKDLNVADFAGLKLVWPAWEAVASCVLKTQRSEDPESKSMFMVWPPMFTGARYSTSPASGVAVTEPVVPLVAADAPPVEAAPAAPVPVALAAPVPVAFAAPVLDPFPFFPLALLFAWPVPPSTTPAAAACATFIASASPGGRGIKNFRYAFTKALVPAPGDLPLKLGFGTRSTLKLRFCIWPGAGAARAMATRARRRTVWSNEGIVKVRPRQVVSLEL